MGQEEIYGKKIVENGSIERKSDELERIVETLAKSGCRMTITRKKDGEINISAECLLNDYC
ncbi:MAG: hypothetical protein ACXQTD_01405 [Candidatus Syntropharchaeia archaeon]